MLEKKLFVNILAVLTKTQQNRRDSATLRMPF